MWIQAGNLHVGALQPAHQLRSAQQCQHQTRDKKELLRVTIRPCTSGHQRPGPRRPSQQHRVLPPPAVTRDLRQTIASTFIFMPRRATG